MSMKFHVFFKGYLAVIGVWGIFVNVCQWLQQYGGIDYFKFVIEAEGVWLPVSLVIQLLVAVVALITGVRLWQMKRDALTWVNVWLGIHVLRQVLAVFTDGRVLSIGFYLGTAVVIVLDWCVYLYYKKRKELFNK